VRCVSGNGSALLTMKYPSARFGIQTLHLLLMRLSLIREFLSSSPVLTRIRRVALFKRPCHCIALSGRACAQRDIMLVLGVDEVLILVL
jgi:hypothetical protein